MFSIRTGVVCAGILGVAAALPAQEMIAQVAPKARSVSTVRVGSTSYLGVGVVEVTEERAKALNMKDTYGVEVKHVDENSPAAKAGLKENDVILEMNGQRIEGTEQFIRMIGETPSGRKVNVSVWRNNAMQNLSATLDARSRNSNFMLFRGVPAPMPPMPPMPDMSGLDGTMNDLRTRLNVLTINDHRVGVETESLTPQLAEFFGVKQGVLVRSVIAKSPAEKAGVKAGDVITKVGGTPVLTAREITGAVNAAKGRISLTVVRNKKEMNIDIEVPEAKLVTPDREVL